MAAGDIDYVLDAVARASWRSNELHGTGTPHSMDIPLPAVNAPETSSAKAPPSGEQQLWNTLANTLDPFTPDNTTLSDDDKADLMVFDLLNQSKARLEQLIAVEVENTETETWNYEAAVQMGNLTQVMGKMPFGASSELFQLQGTAGGKGPSRKGKEREVPQKRSIFHMNPKDSKAAWLGKEGEQVRCIPAV